MFLPRFGIGLLKCELLVLISSWTLHIEFVLLVVVLLVVFLFFFYRFLLPSDLLVLFFYFLFFLLLFLLVLLLLFYLWLTLYLFKLLLYYFFLSLSDTLSWLIHAWFFKVKLIVLRLFWRCWLLFRNHLW